MLQKFLANYGYSPLIGMLLIIAAWILATWANKIVRRVFSERAQFDPTVVRFIAHGIRLAIIVFAAVVVLDEFGVDVTTLIAALSIFGFAIAIGMRQTASSFFTGIMLFVLKPYRVGEYIEGERVTGVVEAIHLFHTELVTPEGIYVSVPNGAMWSSKSIKNFSRPRPVRVELDVGVERQLPFAELAPVIDRILRAEPYGKSGINPHVAIAGTAENAMTVRTAIWTDAEHSWDVRTRLTEKLREGITAAGVTVTSIEVPKKVAPRKKPAAAPSSDEDA